MSCADRAIAKQLLPHSSFSAQVHVQKVALIVFDFNGPRSLAIVTLHFSERVQASGGHPELFLPVHFVCSDESTGSCPAHGVGHHIPELAVNM